MASRASRLARANGRLAGTDIPLVLLENHCYLCHKCSLNVNGELNIPIAPPTS
jgi:hypothetical protein